MRPLARLCKNTRKLMNEFDLIHRFFSTLSEGFSGGLNLSDDAALLDVPLHRYAISTFLGIIPGTLVLTSVGAGLGDVFEKGAEPDLSVFVSPSVLVPILGLVV